MARARRASSGRGGAFPTPLDAAPALAREVGLERLWSKRDDLAAEPYGGSKIRKPALGG